MQREVASNTPGVGVISEVEEEGRVHVRCEGIAVGVMEWRRRSSCGNVEGKEERRKGRSPRCLVLIQRTSIVHVWQDDVKHQ